MVSKLYSVPGCYCTKHPIHFKLEVEPLDMVTNGRSVVAMAMVHIRSIQRQVYM